MLDTKVISVAEIQGKHSIEIRKPVHEVYDYLADFRRHNEWNHQTVEVIITDNGPLVPGAQLHARERPPSTFPFVMKLIFPVMARMMGMASHTEAEIVELDEDKRIRWKARAPFRNGDVGVQSEWQIDFEADADATRVTQRFHYMPAHDRAQKMMSNQEKNDRDDWRGNLTQPYSP